MFLLFHTSPNMYFPFWETLSPQCWSNVLLELVIVTQRFHPTMVISPWSRVKAHYFMCEICFICKSLCMCLPSKFHLPLYSPVLSIMKIFCSTSHCTLIFLTLSKSVSSLDCHPCAPPLSAHTELHSRALQLMQWLLEGAWWQILSSAFWEQKCTISTASGISMQLSLSTELWGGCKVTLYRSCVSCSPVDYNSSSVHYFYLLLDFPVIVIWLIAPVTFSSPLHSI